MSMFPKGEPMPLYTWNGSASGERKFVYESTSMSQQLVSQLADFQCIGDLLPDHIVTGYKILSSSAIWWSFSDWLHQPQPLLGGRVHTKSYRVLPRLPALLLQSSLHIMSTTTIPLDPAMDPSIATTLTAAMATPKSIPKVTPYQEVRLTSSPASATR
jgi:hypothetical protein